MTKCVKKINIINHKNCKKSRDSDTLNGGTLTPLPESAGILYVGSMEQAWNIAKSEPDTMFKFNFVGPNIDYPGFTKDLPKNVFSLENFNLVPVKLTKIKWEDCKHDHAKSLINEFETDELTVPEHLKFDKIKAKKTKILPESKKLEGEELDSGIEFTGGLDHAAKEFDIKKLTTPTTVTIPNTVGDLSGKIDEWTSQALPHFDITADRGEKNLEVGSLISDVRDSPRTAENLLAQISASKNAKVKAAVQKVELRRRENGPDSGGMPCIEVGGDDKSVVEFYMGNPNNPPGNMPRMEVEGAGASVIKTALGERIVPLDGTASGGTALGGAFGNIRSLDSNRRSSRRSHTVRSRGDANVAFGIAGGYAQSLGWSAKGNSNLAVTLKDAEADYVTGQGMDSAAFDGEIVGSTIGDMDHAFSGRASGDHELRGNRIGGGRGGRDSNRRSEMLEDLVGGGGDNGLDLGEDGHGHLLIEALEGSRVGVNSEGNKITNASLRGDGNKFTLNSTKDVFVEQEMDRIGLVKSSHFRDRDSNRKHHAFEFRGNGGVVPITKSTRNEKASARLDNPSFAGNIRIAGAEATLIGAQSMAEDGGNSKATVEEGGKMQLLQSKLPMDMQIKTEAQGLINGSETTGEVLVEKGGVLESQIHKHFGNIKVKGEHKSFGGALIGLLEASGDAKVKLSSHDHRGDKILKDKAKLIAQLHNTDGTTELHHGAEVAFIQAVFEERGDDKPTIVAKRDSKPKLTAIQVKDQRHGYLVDAEDGSDIVANINTLSKDKGSAFKKAAAAKITATSTGNNSIRNPQNPEGFKTIDTETKLFTDSPGADMPQEEGFPDMAPGGMPNAPDMASGGMGGMTSGFMGPALATQGLQASGGFAYGRTANWKSSFAL